MTTDSNEDGLKNIKRKLKEASEVNNTLLKDYQRAKKKIRALTFERNLLLDNISKLDQLSDDQLNDSTDSETEAPFKLMRVPKRVTSSTSNKSIIRELSIQSPTYQQQQQQQKTTVTSAPPKRSKANRIVSKTRRVQPIERDESGHPKLPQQIGVLTVVDLGKIKTDRDTFHNERYIFPVGYTVKRTYPSMIDPNNNTTITSTIIDGGDGPRFHIVAADMPDEPIVANSATGAWTVVVRRSNEIRHRDHSNSASGPDYYGFKHPTIAKMIQDLPGTDMLQNYVWQDFEEMEPRAAKGVMAAAEKKRDNLELMGSANRKVLSEGGAGEELILRMSDNEMEEEEVDELSDGD